MTKKPKIAVIGLKGLPAFGGAAAVGENIIEQLMDHYDFTVYSVSTHADKSYEKIKQIVFPYFPLRKLNTAYYLALATLHALMSKKFDLVHVHHTDLSIIIPLLRLRYKVIITSHGSAYKIKNIDFKYSYFTTKLLILSEKYFLRYANIVSCVSRQLTNDFSKRHNRKIYFIPNGIVAQKVNNKQNKLCNGYLLFAAGRIIPTKGCHIFLKALNHINYKKKVIILGDLNQHKDHTDEIKVLAENLNVEFLGLIRERTLLNSYIANAKLFIFPSSLESMSMMLLEVASLGTPIIASSIIENKDVFDDSEVVFFKTNDYVSLAEKIKIAVNDYSQMEERANNAYFKLKRDFNWPQIAAEYDKLYKSLL